jgi:hypothetical protein
VSKAGSGVELAARYGLNPSAIYRMDLVQFQAMSEDARLLIAGMSKRRGPGQRVVRAAMRRISAENKAAKRLARALPPGEERKPLVARERKKPVRVAGPNRQAREAEAVNRMMWLAERAG